MILFSAVFIRLSILFSNVSKGVEYFHCDFVFHPFPNSFCGVKFWTIRWDRKKDDAFWKFYLFCRIESSITNDAYFQFASLGQSKIFQIFDKQIFTKSVGGHTKNFACDGRKNSPKPFVKITVFVRSYGFYSLRGNDSILFFD